MGVGGLFVDVASLDACVQIRTDYRATPLDRGALSRVAFYRTTSLDRGALSRVTTRSMLTSLPCGQWTVCGVSDEETFWKFWENARVGRLLGRIIREGAKRAGGYVDDSEENDERGCEGVPIIIGPRRADRPSSTMLSRRRLSRSRSLTNFPGWGECPGWTQELRCALSCVALYWRVGFVGRRCSCVGCWWVLSRGVLLAPDWLQAFDIQGLVP